MILGFVTPTTLSSLKMWCGNITSGKSNTYKRAKSDNNNWQNALCSFFSFSSILLSIHIRTSIWCKRCDAFFGLSTSSETISCVCLKESSKKKKMLIVIRSGLWTSLECNQLMTQNKSGIEVEGGAHLLISVKLMPLVVSLQGSVESDSSEAE